MTLRIYATTRKITPFTEPSLIGDFIQSVSTIYNENKIDARLFMPKYGFISDRKYILREVIRLKEIPVPHKVEEIVPSVKSAFIPDTRVQVYFLVNDLFKKISQPIAESHDISDYEVWEQCVTIFDYTAIQTLEYLYWQPDVILCCNMESALIPYLLKKVYHKKDWYKSTKPVLVLSQDMVFKGIRQQILEEFYIGEKEENLNDPVGLLKSAITHAEGVILLENKEFSFLNDLLSDASVNALLKQKGEQYLKLSIENPDENIWNEAAQQVYHFLENI
ncbi:MAG: glycogen/starch synthase [Candidatus Marinimicrobia bacterium]|nr:glycogen/starch synthase [Candidatus Neomarinimicrobiota bacterium]MDD5582397.1 glycogen/starch synthase [Candidatus Neomarinimicrobiota bacterium]